MTNREAKKKMTRDQRKAYKAAQREGLPNYYVIIKAKNEHTIKMQAKVNHNFAKLVARDKANEMIHGKWNHQTQAMEKSKLKHDYIMYEVGE